MTDSQIDLTKVETTLDFLRFLLGKEIKIKCKFNRTLTGVLNAYDEHLNLLISNANEKFVENNVASERKLDTLFIRGDVVVFVSPVMKQKI